MEKWIELVQKASGRKSFFLNFFTGHEITKLDTFLKVSFYLRLNKFWLEKLVPISNLKYNADRHGRIE